MKRQLAILWVVGLCVWCAGCEDDNHKTSIVKVETDEGETGNHYAVSDVGGTWKGRAGTGQTSTVLRLTQNGDSLSGSWTWGAGDTRTCGGYKSGNRVVLWDQKSEGDIWEMTVSEDGRKMSGTGNKYGGGMYALSFSR